MNPDEQAVHAIAKAAMVGCPDRMLKAVRDGINDGRRKYGELVLATDTRSFRRETGQELRDAVVYLAALIERKRADGEDVHAEHAALEHVINAWQWIGGRV